jgi:hypothetical protein
MDIEGFESQIRLWRLACYLAGDFSSVHQANRIGVFHHIDLSHVPIWHNRTDGYWLYVEQRFAADGNAYRRRVYQVCNAVGQADSQPTHQYESRIYNIADPAGLPTLLEDPTMHERLTMDDITPNPGCTVFLTELGDLGFNGVNNCATCLDSSGNNSILTQMLVLRDMVIALDRGYDVSGAQVWGSTAGPYEFIKSEFRTIERKEVLSIPTLVLPTV